MLLILLNLLSARLNCGFLSRMASQAQPASASPSALIRRGRRACCEAKIEFFLYDIVIIIIQTEKQKNVIIY